MKAFAIGTVLAMAAALGLAVGEAVAEAKVSVTREESKPKTVEVKAGEEVRFINSSGGNAHVMFAGQEGVMFYIGGKGGAGRVKFDKPGTYEYTVHISGTKVHAHTGSVVVK
jgi:plastocyanin